MGKYVSNRTYPLIYYILSVFLYCTMMIVPKAIETCSRILIYGKVYFVSVHISVHHTRTAHQCETHKMDQFSFVHSPYRWDTNSFQKSPISFELHLIFLCPSDISCLKCLVYSPCSSSCLYSSNITPYFKFSMLKHLFVSRNIT